MTTFDRAAYLNRVGNLALKMNEAQRHLGRMIEAMKEQPDADLAAVRAHSDFLAALYDLPRDLDGVEIGERAA